MVMAAAASPPVSAELIFNGGTDVLSAVVEYGYAYDSNLFSQAGGQGDYSHSLSFSADYSRRAGLIGVEASAALLMARFRELTDEDYNNPSLKLEFKKEKGRLTGSAGLSVKRENRSEVAINVRTDSWNHESNLDLRYPINDRYYFKSESAYSRVDYRDNRALHDLDSWSESLDVFYVYSSKLDLTGGYRFRTGLASGGARTVDHALMLGAANDILPKLNGTVQVGYQWRSEHGSGRGDFGAFTADVSLTWPVTKRLTLKGVAAKDYTTAATDISVDVGAVSFSATLSPATRLSIDLGVSYSVSDFLGVRGGNREDRALSGRTEFRYAISSKISASLSYMKSRNDSNNAFSDFARHLASITVKARF